MSKSTTVAYYQLWLQQKIVSKGSVRIVLFLDALIQPWESAAAFGSAVPCCFYDGKKNAVVKVFTYVVFLFRFYSVVDNS